MIFFHGRTSGRPYYGNHIFLTPDVEYAKLYTDGSGGNLYEAKLLFSKDKIFSIKNSDHQSLVLSTFGKGIFNRFDLSEEIDWSMLDYLSNDEFERPEDFFKSLGFRAVSLKERTGIDSLYVFDSSDVELIEKR